MASQRIEALPLAHLRCVGGGRFRMRRWAHRTQLLGRLFVLSAMACRPSGERSGSSGITVTDDAGRVVRLAPPARRVVSLAPSITELLFALGAGGEVVGRTAYCQYPPAAKRVPSVGDGLNPNIEAIVARQPDLVLLYRSPHTEAAARQLEALGIATLMLRHDRLEDVARTARLLGRVTGHVPAGAAVAREIEALLAAPPNPPAARIVYIVWDNPPIVIGGGSFLDELARLAGATNVFRDIAAPSATVSIEVIAERDPDWIALLRDTLTTPLPAWTGRPEWRTVRAVRERRFLPLQAELFGQPSPRAPEAVAVLRRALAP
ncbi:MAG: ABC transporter substrate-binding protein [Gemmatimonadales bacterium]